MQKGLLNLPKVEEGGRRGYRKHVKKEKRQMRLVVLHVISQCIDATAAHFDLTREEFLRQGKARDYTERRAMLAHYLSTQGANWCLIGEELGRERTTMMRGVKRIRGLMDVEPETKQTFEDLAIVLNKIIHAIQGEL